MSLLPIPLPTIATRVMSFTGVSFPHILAKFDQLVHNPNARSESIRSAIVCDPLLSAMVLGSANAVRVAPDISASLQQMGLSSVMGLVQECGVVPRTRREAFRGYWEEANATAILTRQLARWLQANRRYPGYLRETDETLHLLGLLHNLGSAVGILLFGDHYDQAGRDLDVHPDRHFRQLLRDNLGMSTGDLGYMLARNWRLPALFADGCRYHHHPLKAERQGELHAVLHVARTIARACGRCDPVDRFLDPIDPGVLSLLNLRSSDFEPIINGFLDEWEEHEAFEPGGG